MMNGLEILDHVSYGHVVHHRERDAWDLLDRRGNVAAVLKPRASYLAVALPPEGDRVACTIAEHELEQGAAIVNRLAVRR
jgi:hypothetical protein